MLLANSKQKHEAEIRFKFILYKFKIVMILSFVVSMFKDICFGLCPQMFF